MLVYEGFFLKKCHLFQLFQFAKSELEQDLANRAKPQVNREKSCSNFFGTNWNKTGTDPFSLAYFFRLRLFRGCGMGLGGHADLCVPSFVHTTLHAMHTILHTIFGHSVQLKS